MDVQESALFLRDCLHEGLYCGHKGKRYAMEVVATAEKLPLDDLEDIKDNSGEAQNQQDSDRDKKQKTIPRRLLKLEDKLEEDQGYASVLPASGAKKQPQILKDMPKESKAKTA